VRELVTTLLDTLGLLLVAAGATGAAWRLTGPGALAVGGLIVLGVSWWWARPPKQQEPKGGSQ
jgi:hypothetical protein